MPADRESLYGAAPTIASVSFGESRDFMLRRNRDRATLRVPLGGGDILVMAGSMQALWQHSVPQRRSVLGPRINLTFRHAIRPSQG